MRVASAASPGSGHNFLLCCAAPVVAGSAITQVLAAISLNQRWIPVYSYYYHVSIWI